MLSSLCMMLNTLLVMLLTVFCQMLRMRMCRAAPSIAVRAPQEAGRAALQAQAGAGANQRPMQPSTEPRKSPQHQKSSKTGPASLHTQSSSGAQAHPRSPVRPPLGPLAARQTHEQSRLARHGGKHKTGSFVIQIFSRHCAVQKTKQPRHVDTPTLSRAASPWDPR